MNIEQKKLISIVVPCFNEASNIDVFFNELFKALHTLDYNHEIIFIDDGSSDNTFEKLEAIYAQNKKILLIGLSRNFGKEAALTAGLDHATGDTVILMDADLQHPPVVINKMLEKWQEGFQVVTAVRNSRIGESITYKFFSRVFYKILNKFSDVPFPKQTSDFRLFDKKVVDAISNMPEKNRFMRGIFTWVGFKSVDIFYDSQPRFSGNSKWSFSRLVILALDGIFSLTSFPLKIWTYIGFLISLIAAIYSTYTILNAITYGIDVPGYVTIFSAVMFLGGIQLISLGIIGEYIARIYNESKNRPIYIVNKKAEIRGKQ